MPTSDARLDDLESKLTFQEDALNELNAALISQQQQIDQLRAAVSALAERLRSASEPSDPGADERPPHY